MSRVISQHLGTQVKIEIRLAQILVTVVLLSSALCGIAFSQIPSGRDVVTPARMRRSIRSRAAALQLAVVMKIRDGFHINAREPPRII